MAESNWQRAARYAQENAAFAARFAILDALDLQARQSPLEPYPPIDLHKRADGVWVMPE